MVGYPHGMTTISGLFLLEVIPENGADEPARALTSSVPRRDSTNMEAASPSAGDVGPRKKRRDEAGKSLAKKVTMAAVIAEVNFTLMCRRFPPKDPSRAVPHEERSLSQRSSHLADSAAKRCAGF